MQATASLRRFPVNLTPSCAVRLTFPQVRTLTRCAWTPISATNSPEMQAKHSLRGFRVNLTPPCAAPGNLAAPCAAPVSNELPTAFFAPPMLQSCTPNAACSGVFEYVEIHMAKLLNNHVFTAKLQSPSAPFQ